jgi:hypothetical protein
MSDPEFLPTLSADDSLTDPRHGFASRRDRDLSLLWIAITVLTLSCTLRIRADQRVELSGFAGLVAPELCGSSMWLGIDCPGCGLTRGFVRLAAGDWTGAVAWNRVTPLLALAVVAQLPYRGAMLLGWPPARRFAESAWPHAFGWLLIVALIGNWLLKLMGV